VRKFQKGKETFFKKFYNFVFRTVFLRIAFGYMDSETSISKREKPIVGRYCVFRFFRRQPVSDEVLKKLKESEDPGKFLGLYWLESDFEGKKQSEILQNQKTDGKKQRGGTRMSVSVGQSGMTWNIFL